MENLYESLYTYIAEAEKLYISDMAVTLPNVNSPSGLKKLDEYLLSRSYITGYVTMLAYAF